MALEETSDELLSDEESVLEERVEMLGDDENLVDVDEFLEQL